MISIVIPGRNDNFGYNLHKRYAISLNCFAANMRDADDEIIFVDYNTPNHLPTLPEAIADTLTKEARARLRVLRVRPSVLETVGPLEISGIQMVIAYNVGFRRSNPNNRWVLATTSDHIVASRDPEGSIPDILSRLPDGFYSLPRYEVPQLLWEEFDRTRPHEILRSLQSAAELMHLREGIFDRAPVEIDNCGDFQLMLRQDLFAISGLDERMITGWQHSDANLHARLCLLRGLDAAMDGALDLYHCSHQRSVSTTQTRVRIEHDWDYFVSGLQTPYLPFQKESWGLASAPVEEIRLEKGPALAQGVATAIGKKQALPMRTMKHLSFDAATLPVGHVLPHIADQLASYQSGATVGYIGANRDMVKALAQLMREWRRAPLSVAASPFTEWPSSEKNVGELTETSRLLDSASILVVDFSVARSDSGADKDVVLLQDCSDAAQRALSAVDRCWRDLVEVERKRMAEGRPGRPILVVNAIHTSHEGPVSQVLVDGVTPFTTRTRAGVIAGTVAAKRPSAAEVFDYVSDSMGRRASAADISAALTALMLLRSGTPVEEVPQRMLRQATSALLDWPVMQGFLPPATLQAMKTRLATAAITFGNVGATLDRFHSPDGRLTEDGWVIDLTRGDRFVIGGPYVPLEPGDYEAVFEFECQNAVGPDKELRLYVTDSADRVLVVRPLRDAALADPAARTVRFRVEHSGVTIEFRIEVLRFFLGELRFRGLTYRRV